MKSPKLTTFLLLIGLILTSLTATTSRQAQAQSGQEILNVGLRDSYGKPLSGVLVEALSYDWGLPVGQPYVTIAKGLTDKNGVIAFDVTVWPHSGYKFRFTKTSQTIPADTYFMPDSQNQYRGYPAVVTGGQPGIDNEHFVIDGDGLAYNDLATNGQGSPIVSKDPVGGMLLPRVSPSALSSQNYMATARSNTATAYADGVPTLTPPPPPQPFKGVAAPLTITPAATATANATSSPTITKAGATTGATGQSQGQAKTTPSTPGTVYQTTPEAETAARAAQSDFGGSLFLAIFGITCLFLFFKFKPRIYKLIGAELPALPKATKTKGKAKKIKQPKPAKAKTTGNLVPTPAPAVKATAKTNANSEGSK